MARTVTSKGQILRPILQFRSECSRRTAERERERIDADVFRNEFLEIFIGAVSGSEGFRQDRDDVPLSRLRRIGTRVATLGNSEIALARREYEGVRYRQPRRAYAQRRIARRRRTYLTGISRASAGATNFDCGLFELMNGATARLTGPTKLRQPRKHAS